MTKVFIKHTIWHSQYSSGYYKIWNGNVVYIELCGCKTM